MRAPNTDAARNRFQVSREESRLPSGFPAGPGLHSLIIRLEKSSELPSCKVKYRSSGAFRKRDDL